MKKYQEIKVLYFMKEIIQIIVKKLLKNLKKDLIVMDIFILPKQIKLYQKKILTWFIVLNME